MLSPLWLGVRFAIIVCMFEAIDRWENEGGAPLVYPPQPLLSERDNTQAATGRHATSDRAVPAGSAQTGPSTSAAHT